MRSFFQYCIDACGMSLFPLLFAAVAAYVITFRLLKFGQNPAAWAALILIVPMPVLVGVFAALSKSHNVWAHTPLGTTISTTDLAVASAEILIPLWVGMMLSAPTYLVAVIGLLIRSFGKDVRGST